MILLYLILYFRVSWSLLLTMDNRNMSRNITCQHGLLPGVKWLVNCEACLITSRNYLIETTLSIAGAGPQGFSYTCLQTNNVEIYHENLVRECRYFPKNLLPGYDDFCIASPYNLVRGSYRACICITNDCNIDYSRCIQPLNPNRYPEVPVFNSTVKELTNRVKCYQPYEDYKPQINSSLTKFCSNNDEKCQDYIFENGVLCLIRVDQNNQVTRQTLIPSMYTSYIINHKNQFCNASSMTSRSISFSQCEFKDTICMCTTDECNKDLGTCEKNEGMKKNVYFLSLLLVFVLIINI